MDYGWFKKNVGFVVIVIDIWNQIKANILQPLKNILFFLSEELPSYLLNKNCLITYDLIS